MTRLASVSAVLLALAVATVSCGSGDEVVSDLGDRVETQTSPVGDAEPVSRSEIVGDWIVISMRGFPEDNWLPSSPSATIGFDEIDDSLLSLRIYDGCNSAGQTVEWAAGNISTYVGDEVGDTGSTARDCGRRSYLLDFLGLNTVRVGFNDENLVLSADGRSVILSPT